MNNKLLLSTVLLLLYVHISLAASNFDKPFTILGDSIPCILFLELEQAENEEYIISLISDTTWTFPRNIISTAQITVKVPTGGFEISDLTDLIDGVSFFQSGRDNSPTEAPGFDYISFSLGSQGTSSVTFEKGRKVGLFSFKNSGVCPDGFATLMNNFSDPFFPPNSAQSNSGQQITVSGYGAPDLPIGIQGNGVSCNPTTNPVDTMTTTPVDTMTTTPVDTMTTTPVDTTDNSGETPPFVDSDLTAQIAVQNISCQGANDGIIVLKVENGSPPYTYTWSTGATTSSIENLFPGEYTVQIRDQTGFTIERTITILEPGVLIVQISKANASQAGASDGKGRAIITGGTAPFSYNWSNQGTTAEQTGLAEGTYSLTVTDANGCTDEKTIEIIDQSQCPVIDVLLDMDAPICAGESTGQILITPQGGQAPFSYVWENGNGTNFIRDIAPDLYMVTVTDGVGCTMAVSAMLPDASPLSVSLEITEGTSPNSGQIAAAVAGGMAPYTYQWNTTATAAAIENLAGGVYMLSVTDSKGCEKVVSGIISTVTCALDVFNGSTAIEMEEVLCGEKGTFCIPIPLDSMVNYSIFLNDEDYSNNLKGCQFETFYAYSYSFFPSGNTAGTYLLREWVVDGVSYSGAFQTIDALVDSMNTWNPTGNWVNLKEVSIIQGGQPDATYGSLAIIAGAVSTILDVNSNLTPRGTEITFKPGAHQLILVKNTSACSDTLNLNLPCSGESRDSLITIVLQEGEQQSLCLPALFGNALQVAANNCPDLSGTSAILTLDNTSNCIDIAGILAGQEEACYQITDASGNIITVTIKITVLPATISCVEFARDTFYAFAPSCNPSVFCLDIPYDLIFDATITENSAPYTGGIESCSLGGTQFSFNQAGVYNLTINYGNNCSQDIVIFVACDENQVIEQTIETGTIDVVCINLPGLLGPPETVENICPDESGTHVIFEILANSGCVSYTGISIGTDDNACIKICDQFGFCDTVQLIFHVADPDGLPGPIFEAVDDSATIRLNSSVVLDILGNDLFRTIDTIIQVTEAEHGEVFINPDGTITYIAQTGYCDDTVPDVFQYSICEAAVCDTATVSITITCALGRDLVVYNGISPNGDGINDSFRIDGIENYPGNKVNIYNRWGNRVFHMDGYKNEWTGTWSDDRILPDGTYIYIVDLGDGSSLLKGYIEIRR